MLRETPIKLLTIRRDYDRQITPSRMFSGPQFGSSKNTSEQYLPHASIVNNIKRTYPLNFKAYKAKEIKVKHSRHQSLEETPEFMHEFVSNPFKPEIEAKSALNSNFITSSSSRNVEPRHKRSQSTEPRVESHSSLLKLKDFTGNKASIESGYGVKNKDKSFYKPHTIYITPRSKIVLYSSIPINLKPEQTKPVNTISQSRSRKSSKYIFQERPINSANALQKQVQPEVFPITQPALTFGAKLLRIKELIVDPYVKEESFK